MVSICCNAVPWPLVAVDFDNETQIDWDDLGASTFNDLLQFACRCKSCRSGIPSLRNGSTYFSLKEFMMSTRLTASNLEQKPP
jgi:hypothetical protein